MGRRREDSEEENDGRPSTTRRSKRLKTRHVPDSSSPSSRPYVSFDPSSSKLVASFNSRAGLLSPIRSLHSSQENNDTDVDNESEDEGLSLPPPAPLRRLAPIISRGLDGQLTQRELGGVPRPGLSFVSRPVSDWRNHTANFHSTPSDVYECRRANPMIGFSASLPFCTATGNKTGFVAIGDEDGNVHLNQVQSINTNEIFQAHDNAILDLSFSQDDRVLATASGDQTGHVIDIETKHKIATLRSHTASLKQIRFQPGRANRDVLATSSRDGSVQIWDLRCHAKAMQNILADLERVGFSSEGGLDNMLTRPGAVVNSMYSAHARTLRQVRHGVALPDIPSAHELPGRVGDVSITALQWMPEGQEHLLLTGCEADATIKLWDTRLIHSSKQKIPTPLSVTAPPSSHATWRSFGITSLALNTDASRMYALCKDHTVYAYSTAHLILGHAPELSTRNDEPPRRRHNAVPHQGLGPLYGFRHTAFHATSFYVKCAVRPARNGQSELLAVGSSDACPVLFPTDERYFRDDLAGNIGSLTRSNHQVPPWEAALSFIDDEGNIRAQSRPPRTDDDIPIITNGTALVRSHHREVGSVAWSDKGRLITASDDFTVRSWDENQWMAKSLRTGGEFGGRRWRRGYAMVEEGYDRSDDEL